MTSIAPTHQSKYQNLSPSGEPTLQPCIKICAYFNKLPSTSYEDFYKHWATVHADLTVASEAFKGTVLRYIQVLFYNLETCLLCTIG